MSAGQEHRRPWPRPAPHYVGLPVDEAVTMATDEGLQPQVVEWEPRSRGRTAVSEDLRSHRMRLVVRDGVVTEARRG